MNKRFDQLLSFLKDPQAHPHPAITLEDRIYVNRGTLIPLRVKVFSQEAIEIMESGMFHQGLLKGNRRTPDVAINNLEALIMEAAAAFYLSKKQLSDSLWPYYLDSDGQPQVIEHTLITAHNNMMKAFEEFREIVLNPPPPVIRGKSLIRPDKMLRICDDLDVLLSKALNKV